MTREGQGELVSEAGGAGFTDIDKEEELCQSVKLTRLSGDLGAGKRW